eukprot:1122463-Pelagomonas_calceolata.AAC.1
MNKIPKVGVGMLIRLQGTNKILVGKRLGSMGHETWAVPGAKLVLLFVGVTSTLGWTSRVRRGVFRLRLKGNRGRNGN